MLASDEDFNFPNLATPDVPDISDRPTRDSLNKAVEKSQCAYIRTGIDENPNLLIAFMTFYGKLGLDLRTLIETAETTKHDILVIGDTRRDFLLQGVEKWGMSLFESVAAMARFAETHGKQVIDVIGHSSGAITALTYAPLMKVRRCIVFNPYTKFSNVEVDPDSIYIELTKNVRRLIIEENVLKQPEGEREQFLEIRNSITQARFDTAFHVHFSAANLVNRVQARHVSDLPSVTLHGHEYRKHNLTNYLHQEGMLKDVLLGALSSGPVPVEESA